MGADVDDLMRELARAPDASIPRATFGAEGVTLAPRATLIAIGTIVADRFEIVAALGRGGTGEVYRARDRELGREVAIKVLAALDDDRRRRFLHEARIASALRHDNVLAVHDVGSHDGSPFLVLELVDGETLRDRLASGPLSPALALDFTRQLVRGLVAAHDVGIVHRDLKPENLLVTRDDRLKICDFGLAKLTGDALPAIESLTVDGAIVGTLGYMSPEQARGEPVDHRSDVFAFGTIVVEMVTGKPAFRGASTAETLSAILRDDPPGLAALPPALAHIVRRCVDKRSAKRFQSTRDLAFALDQLAEPARAPNRLAIANGLALAGLVGIVSLAGASHPAPSSAPTSTAPAFARLTFQRGRVSDARFAADGTTVVYSAAWDGAPHALFATRANTFESRPLGADGEILAVSRHGDLYIKRAITRRALWSFYSAGKLARTALDVGGVPRDLLDDVSDADVAPDGSLAVVRWIGMNFQIEWPLGTVVAERRGGWIGSARVSPDGKHLAYLDHTAPEDDKGSVVVLDAEHRATTLADGYLSIQGLAWSPSGDAVYYTGVRVGSQRELHAVTLADHRDRVVYRAPGALRLLDIAANGHLLVAREDVRARMVGRDRDGSERDLSWLDGTAVAAVSRDGETVLFAESWDGAGTSYGLYARPFAGGPAVRVVDGSGSPDLSPDGTRILNFVDHVGSGHYRVESSPVSAGDTQVLLDDPATASVRWLPDGRVLVVDHAGALAVLDGAGQRPRPLGVHVGELVYLRVSPDGTTVAGVDPAGNPQLFSLADGRARPIPSALPNSLPFGFTHGGRGVYMLERAQVPVQLAEIDLATGERRVDPIALAERAGVESITGVGASDDGRRLVYSYVQTLSTLFEVTDLR